MTPQEKAKELYSKFGGNVNEVYPHTATINCCLIALNEIIDELQSYSDLKSTIFIYDDEYSVVERIEYWKSVKLEIMKL